MGKLDLPPGYEFNGYKSFDRINDNTANVEISLKVIEKNFEDYLQEYIENNTHLDENTNKWSHKDKLDFLLDLFNDKAFIFDEDHSLYSFGEVLKIIYMHFNSIEIGRELSKTELSMQRLVTNNFLGSLVTIGDVEKLLMEKLKK